MLWEQNLTIKYLGKTYQFKTESTLEDLCWRFLINDNTDDPILTEALFIDFDLKNATFSHWPVSELNASICPVIEKELLLRRKEWVD